MEVVSAQTMGDVWQPVIDREIVIDQRLILVFRDWVGLEAANLGLTNTRGMGLEYIRVLYTDDETGKFSSNAFIVQKGAPQSQKITLMKVNIFSNSKFYLTY